MYTITLRNKQFKETNIFGKNNNKQKFLAIL